MAITKLLRIKAAVRGNPSAGLKRCIAYICDPEKTENRSLITGNAGGLPDFIYREMVANKEYWQKSRGSQGFHYVISFAPSDTVDHRLALQIADEFAQALLNNQYLYVIACHTDTDHVHCHLVFDSVSYTSGQMYHSGKYDWHERIQPLADRLCRKYGLTTLSYEPESERKSMYHQEWEEAKKDGRPKRNTSWNDLIRDDIDACISAASNWEEFLLKLQALHYKYRDGKYLSLCPYGKEHSIRTVRLGPGYSKEELKHRIGKPAQMSEEGRSYQTYGDSIPVYQSAWLYSKQGKHPSPFQQLYWKRWFALSHVRRPHTVPAWKYKKDVTRIGKITDQIEYLFRNDITNKSGIEEKLQALARQRGTEAARERRLCKNILAEYERMQEPDDILQETHIYNVPFPTEQTIYQIHINQVLFGRVDLNHETFPVRIPGKDEYVQLYSADSRIYNQGKTISTYLYPEAEYIIENQQGEYLRRITGESLAGYYKAKELTRKESPVWTRN